LELLEDIEVEPEPGRAERDAVAGRERGPGVIVEVSRARLRGGGRGFEKDPPAGAHLDAGGRIERALHAGPPAEGVRGARRLWYPGGAGDGEGLAGVRVDGRAPNGGPGRAGVSRPVLEGAADGDPPRFSHARELEGDLPWIVLGHAGDVERRDHDV